MPAYGHNMPYPTVPDEVCSGGQCDPERDIVCAWHDPDIDHETDEDDDDDTPGEIGNF